MSYRTIEAGCWLQGDGGWPGDFEGCFRLSAVDHIELMISVDMSVLQAVSDIDQVHLFQE